jgi:hypothetical protein
MESEELTAPRCLGVRASITAPTRQTAPNRRDNNGDTVGAIAAGQLHTAPEGHGQKKYLKYTTGQTKPMAMDTIPTIPSAKTVKRGIRYTSVVSDSCYLRLECTSSEGWSERHEPRLHRGCEPLIEQNRQKGTTNVN